MLAGLGFADDRDEVAVVGAVIVAAVGLSQLVPAVLAVVLVRRHRTSPALLVSGAAAFVTGAMIVFLVLTGDPDREGYLVAGGGLLLAGLGFHQLLVRSRLD